MDNQQSQEPDSSLIPHTLTTLGEVTKKLLARYGPSTETMTPEEKIKIEQAIAKRQEERRIQEEQHEKMVAERQKAEKVRVLVKSLGARYRPGIATLDSFEMVHPGQREVVYRLRKMADQIGVMTAEGKGIVFVGSVGTGKDHLAAAMLYIAAGVHGKSAKWVNGSELFGVMRDSMGENGRAEREIIEEFTFPDVLCISDPLPPVGAPTQWQQQLLYRIIDARYHDVKPTWATLNVADTKEAETRLTPPVFDRLRHNAEFVPCFWPSYRKERKG